MSERTSRMLLRRDLVRRRVSMGSQQVWVLKDPLSRQLFYFSDQEYELLGLADGERTLSQIAEACRDKFAPKHFSTESLVRFYADAQKKGLLSISGSRTKRSTSESTEKSKLNPLAIRFPGINPDRMLDRFVPLVRPLVSPLALIASALLMLVAAFLAVIHFDSLVADVQLATTSFRSGSGLVLLLLVISVTKIVHELAHALSCKVFGGECRELGVMLLVGVPCLYCDVSDAWLMERRWKRVFVSAAGMMAELTLAALATFVWLAANDGIVQDLCVMVMVVCSVTTLLFNGNPLLRYDGYYMLSDLSGIPNLASESSGLIRQRLRRLIWGLPESMEAVSPTSACHPRFLAAYGIASGAYRLFVYGVICLMLYRIAEDYQLAAIAAVCVLLMFARVLYRMVTPVMTPPKTAFRFASNNRLRPALIVLPIAAFLFAFTLLPMPRSVVAPMSIQPANAKTIYVARGGEVQTAISSAADVLEGDEVARLRNVDSEREFALIESKCEQLSKEIESLRGLRGASPEVAARIPTLVKALEEATSRKEAQQTILQQFTLRSPQQGRLFAPPSRPPMNTANPLNHEPEFWTGYPSDRENRGAWLQEGTVFGLVGDPDEREATLLLRQQEIELIRVNQKVTLLLPDHPRGSVTGHVIEVAVAPITEVPVELSATGLADPIEYNTIPRYQVRVRLDRAQNALPVRLTGRARIAVDSASILQRVSRFLSDSFG